MMDDTMLTYLEKNKDEANPSYWIPKLIAEIRRLRAEDIVPPCDTPCPYCA